MAKPTHYVVNDDGVMSPAYEGDDNGPDPQPVQPDSPSGYAAMKKDELVAEVARRNDNRDSEHPLQVAAPGNKAELIAALEADDAEPKVPGQADGQTGA